MTDPEIALCLEMLERTNESDIDGLLSYCHEDVECEPFLAQVEGGSFHGHEGMRRWWDERDAAWETIRIEPGEIRKVGRYLVMHGVFHTKARGSQMDFSMPFAQGALIRDGKVAWWGVYATEDEVLERVKTREAEL